MTKKTVNKKQTRPKLTGRSFDALTDAEKQKIIGDIESMPRGELWRKSKPLTAADRKRFAPIRAKIGRPKIGKGAKVVAVSVEADLLAEADAVARREGIGRTELFVRGLRLALGKAG